MKKKPKPGSVYTFTKNGVVSFAVAVTDAPPFMDDGFSAIVIWVNPAVNRTYVVGQHENNWFIHGGFKKVSKKKLAKLFGASESWLSQL